PNHTQITGSTRNEPKLPLKIITQLGNVPSTLLLLLPLLLHPFQLTLYHPTTQIILDSLNLKFHSPNLKVHLLLQTHLLLILEKKCNHNLKILQLNINGIRNKATELQQLLIEENIDVAVIQETRLQPSSKTPTIPNYSFTRQDRHTTTSAKPKTIGGGLIICIKDNLPYTNTTSYTLPDIETQAITIPLTKTKNLIITNLYIPQRNPTTTNQQNEDANINILFSRLTNIPNSIIVGDINAHS